jgi:hypothetical protein
MDRTTANNTSYTHRPVADNIYDLMRQIIEENPGVSETKINRLYRKAIMDEPDLMVDYIDATIWLIRSSITIKNKKQPKVKGKHKARDEILFFLDHVMTCTFAKVATLGARFTKLAAMGQPDEIVGQVLSEKQVKAVLLGKG